MIDWLIFSVRFVVLAALFLLSACSTIKQWFPDKEKDYQYTTEIPELVLPPDLQNPQGISLPTVSPAPTEAMPVIAPSVDTAGAEPANPIPAFNAPEAALMPQDNPMVDEPEIVPEESVAIVSPEDTEPSPETAAVTYQVETISDDGQKGLRIHTPFANAWRAVDKALSRKSIEVNARDRDNKQFIVRYDPDEHDVQDSSFWDEVDFFFYGLKSKEKAYVLKLSDGGQWTGVMVFDEENQPASDEGAAQLIQLLKDAIASDFAR